MSFHRGLVVLLATFCFCLSYGQTETVSMVYIKGGTKLIGQLVPGENSIIISSGDTMTYNPANVKWIRHFTDVLMFGDGRYQPTAGVYGQFDIGFNFEIDPHSQVSFRLGKRLNKDLSVGVGVGFHANEFFAGIPTISPGLGAGGIWFTALTTNLTADARYYLSDWKRRPYAFGNLGYGFANNNEWDNITDEKGGLNAQFGLGMQWSSRRSIRYFVEFGQYFQKFSAASMPSENPLDPIYNLDIWFKHLDLRIGFRFK